MCALANTVRIGTSPLSSLGLSWTAQAGCQNTLLGVKHVWLYWNLTETTHSQVLIVLDKRPETLCSSNNKFQRIPPQCITQKPTVTSLPDRDITASELSQPLTARSQSKKMRQVRRPNTDNLQACISGNNIPAVSPRGRSLARRALSDTRPLGSAAFRSVSVSNRGVRIDAPGTWTGPRSGPAGTKRGACGKNKSTTEF